MKYQNILILFLFLVVAPTFAQQKEEMRPKIGIVLSGGGAKGIAHIAVLKELEKKGIRPDYVVGTSFGALVAGFYALGFSPEDMETIIKTRDWDYLLNDKINRENILIGEDRKNKNTILTLHLDGITPTMPGGLNTGQNILTFFDLISREYNREMNFDSLKIPFRCVATNIVTGEEKVFSKGRISEVMRASMSIPSVFTPFEIDNELYVDGGLVNNFPTDIVKKMGADIIIGVDVGASLYTKEEINSIVKILDQSTSFYNARVSKKNKKLCDVYIRPKIDGISAMDFALTDSILNLGKQATLEVMPTIDSILEKHPNIIVSPSVSILSDSVNIQKITINTNSNDKFKNKAIENLVLGKLKLKVPQKTSIKQLSNHINQVYGSQYFEKVSLEFHALDTGFNMFVSVEEKNKNNFYIGARFDQTYGVNVLLRAEFRNFLIYGSLFELKAIIGQSPELKLRYTTDRGEKLGIGSSFTYDYFDAASYKDDKILANYSYRRAVWDFFLQSHLGNYNRILLGAESSVFSLSSTQSYTDLRDINQLYFNGYLAYIMDSHDKAYYPQKGYSFKVRGDLIMAENSVIYPHAWMRADGVFSISSKLKIIAEGFLGVSSPSIDTTMFRYNAGGMENNRIDWYNAFPGLRFLEKGSSNVWILKVSPRYEFYKNNYLTYTFALMAMDKNTFKMFSNADNFYSGMSLKYGFDSMFGPLEISVDYSLQSYYSHVFVSLGYWF